MGRLDVEGQTERLNAKNTHTHEVIARPGERLQSTHRDTHAHDVIARPGERLRSTPRPPRSFPPFQKVEPANGGHGLDFGDEHRNDQTKPALYYWITVASVARAATLHSLLKGAQSGLPGTIIFCSVSPKMMFSFYDASCFLNFRIVMPVMLLQKKNYGTLMTKKPSYAA